MIYSTNDKFKIKTNDLVIFPKDIPKQFIDIGIQLDTIKYVTKAHDPFTFFSGNNYGSLYNNFSYKPA